jgi:hypothetical protein
MRRDLCTPTSKRRDHVAGVDEIEGTGLQLAVEEIIDGELHVGDAFRVQERAGGLQQALVDVGADHPSRGANPVAEDPEPTQRSAADVQDAQAGPRAERGE